MSNQEYFLQHAQHVALYGLKRSGKGYAHSLRQALQAHHPELKLSAIHPTRPAFNGLPVECTAQELDPPPDCAIIALKPEDAFHALEDAARGRIRRVWLVLDAASQANLDRAETLGLEATTGCPFLYIAGMGFPHNFHRFLARLFDKL